MKIFENNRLLVEFGELPFPEKYYYKDTNTVFSGAMSNQSLGINGVFYQLSEIKMAWDNTTVIINAGEGQEYKFTITYTLEQDALLGKIVLLPESRPIEWLDFTGMVLLKCDDTFSYARDSFTQNSWNIMTGRGLHNERYEEGKITGAIPQKTGEAGVHACMYNGKVCAFVRTDYEVSPLFTKLNPHEKFSERSGEMQITLNKLFFDLVDKKFSEWNFGVHFCQDLNRDGNANVCDYQLALKPYLETPWYDYKDAIVYKIMCEMNGNVFTTFAQALDIVKTVSRLTGGSRQIVYLTGWQYDGHDTGYPSFDKVNEKLGTVEELREFIRISKENYNTVVSVHVNIDDTYKEHPGFDEAVISRDVDGSMMKWEVFGGKQSYHISHVKDVRQKKVYQRIDALLNLLPLEESVHFDAFRNMNYSWETDEFIGGDKEWYCGMKPIIDYMRAKGVDITTEAQNGMSVEIASMFSFLWHSVEHFPVLYHNRLSGGKGDACTAQAVSSELDYDFTYGQLQNGQIVRWIGQQHLLCKYLRQRNLVNVSNEQGMLTAEYDDGTVAKACDALKYLFVKSGEMVIASEGTKFIPLGDKIFVWSDSRKTISRVLPPEYHGKSLKVEVLWNRADQAVNYSVNGNEILMEILPDTLAAIQCE